MFVSVKRLPRLALSMLPAMLLLSLSGNPSVAQASDPLAPQGAPGQVVEVIAPAATVVETMHYQAGLTLACAAGSCSGVFPKPGAKRRLNVTRVTCALTGPANSNYRTGWLELRNADNTLVLAPLLPADYAVSNSYYLSITLNQAVDVQVGSKRYIRVVLYLTTSGAQTGRCTASGTLDKLQ